MLLLQQPKTATPFTPKIHTRYEDHVKAVMSEFQQNATSYLHKQKSRAEQQGKKLLILLGTPQENKSANLLSFSLAKATKAIGIERFITEYAPDDSIGLEISDLSNPSPKDLHYFFCSRHLDMAPAFANKYTGAEANQMRASEDGIIDYENPMFQYVEALNEDAIFFISNTNLPGALNSFHLMDFVIAPIVTNHIHAQIPFPLSPILERRQQALEHDGRIIHKRTPEVEAFSSWQILSMVTSPAEYRKIEKTAEREGRLPYSPQEGQSPI